MSHPQYFVGIGAQRAGTTWLGEYFSAHPQVGFSPIKELHYFDVLYRADLCSIFNAHFINQYRYELSRKRPDETKDDLRWLEMRLEMISSPWKYKEYFRLLGNAGEIATGEITPAYSLLDRVGFKAILEIFPDAKFLFILRNPCERFWSHLKFHESRISGFKAEEKAFSCLENPAYFLRTDYQRTILELYETVPENQVLLMFFEKLFDPERNTGELKKITQFVGIDFLSPAIPPLNESNKKPLPDEYRKRFFEHFDFVYQFIYQLFKGNIPQSWLNDMKLLE